MERKEEPSPILHKTISACLVSDNSRSSLPFAPAALQKQHSNITPFGQLEDVSNRQNYLASGTTMSSNTPVDKSIESGQSLENSLKSAIAQPKDNRIPIYNADKRKGIQNFMKKPKRPDVSKTYIKI